MPIFDLKVNDRPAMGIVFAAANLIGAVLGAVGLLAGLAAAWRFGWSYTAAGIIGQVFWEALIYVFRDWASS